MNRRRFSDCCRGVRKDRYFASGGSFHVRRIVSHSADSSAAGGSRVDAGALRHVKNRNADPLPPRSSGRVGCTGSDDTRSQRAILLCRRRARYRITNIIFFPSLPLRLSAAQTASRYSLTHSRHR